MKYFRHFPLAVWAFVALALGAVLAVAQYRTEPIVVTRMSTASISNERANAMALVTHLATVHAAAAPPATGLAQWGSDTARLAQGYADARAMNSDDTIAEAYRDIAAAALGLVSVDPSNREQILSGIAALGASGTRLGAAVNGLTPVMPSSVSHPVGKQQLTPSEISPDDPISPAFE